MKTLLLLVTLAVASISFADENPTVVIGGFGTDGATGESMPYKSSAAMATEIYNALDIEPTGDLETKEIETSDGEFSCNKPITGVHSKTGLCLFTAFGRISLDLPHTQAVVLGNEISKAIFEALPTGIERVGATTKKVANITCTKIVSKNIIYKCEIIDTMANSVDVNMVQD